MVFPHAKTNFCLERIGFWSSGFTCTDAGGKMQQQTNGTFLVLGNWKFFFKGRSQWGKMASNVFVRCPWNFDYGPNISWNTIDNTKQTLIVVFLLQRVSDFHGAAIPLADFSCLTDGLLNSNPVVSFPLPVGVDEICGILYYPVALSHFSPAPVKTDRAVRIQ